MPKNFRRFLPLAPGIPKIFGAHAVFLFHQQTGDSPPVGFLHSEAIHCDGPDSPPPVPGGMPIHRWRRCRIFNIHAGRSFFSPEGVGGGFLPDGLEEGAVVVKFDLDFTRDLLDDVLGGHKTGRSLRTRRSRWPFRPGFSAGRMGRP